MGYELWVMGYYIYLVAFERARGYQIGRGSYVQAIHRAAKERRFKKFIFFYFDFHNVLIIITLITLIALAYC